MAVRQKNDYALVTFDSDFIDLAILKGFPPKIIWLKMGNSSTENIALKIVDKLSVIEEFMRDENAFLEID